MLHRVAATLARTMPASRGVLRAPTAALPGMSYRGLNLHEHESMELMARFGIPVPRGSIAKTGDEAERIYEDDLAGGEKADVVVKAQVLAGGRGKGTFTSGFRGGVHLVTRGGQARDYANKMIGERLVTNQTGKEGRPCNKVFVLERVYMRQEMYLSLLFDRAYGGAVLVASPEGGTSIEEVAAATPERVLKEAIVDLDKGPTSDQISRVVNFLGFSSKAKKEAEATVRSLYKMFLETDATLVEVNPLAETPDGRVFVCDAKINFDDNAAFRQKDIFALRDHTQEDPREVEAATYDLNYIGLGGDIGCMVNGAGLAMATMDIIKLNGGEPANFLDVGGGATEAQVAAAFRLLNDDKNVRAILVNIFGGIMRCDVIAHGIVAAAKEIGLRKPIVLRLQGTNVEAAKEVIEASGFRMILEDDLDKAAKKAVRVSDIVRQAQEISVDVKFELPL